MRRDKTSVLAIAMTRGARGKPGVKLDDVPPRDHADAHASKCPMK